MSESKLTVHVVAHAHIDPVWQWRKGAGIDECLATCRAARDRLLEYPEATYIQGEAWIYEQIEKIDPELFASIQSLVAEGRWEIVGGWYMQPDCNFPTIESFRKQIELGQSFFKSRFGRTPRVGFNPDAFGHAASLPDLLTEYGYKYYVHMRPDRNVMPLDSPHYRWRGIGGAELIASRTAEAYNGPTPGDLDHQVRVIRQLQPKHIPHALAFIGAGDHGGGATADLIEHVLNQRHAHENTEIVFSTFDKFFQCIEPLREQLPVKEGEIHYFAIGCYSVNREIKTSMRTAEHALIRAESSLDKLGDFLSPEQRNDASRTIESGWKRVLFNQFHDILPGSLIARGKIDSVRELGGVIADAYDMATLLTRRIGLAQPPNDHQRLFIANLSDTAFDGMVEHEPWVNYEAFWDFELFDEDGNKVPYQRTDSEPYSPWYFRMLIPVKCEAGRVREFTLRPARRLAPKPADSDAVSVSSTSLECGFWKIDLSSTGVGQIWLKGANGATTPLFGRRGCVVEIASDTRDTWAMLGPGDFLDEPLAVFNGGGLWTVEERGPIRATLCQTMRVGDSVLAWRVRLFTNSPRIEFDLKLKCREEHKRFTMRIPFAEKILSHIDGIPGASLERVPSGLEYPFQDWTLLKTAKPENDLSVLTPDTFSFSVRENEMHFTLLRAKPYAWCGTDPARAARTGDTEFTDQGEFNYHFVLTPARPVEDLAHDARGMQQPPVVWDLTKGMQRSTKYLYGNMPTEEELR